MEKSINCYTNETTNASNKINRQIIICDFKLNALSFSVSPNSACVKLCSLRSFAGKLPIYTYYFEYSD